MRRFLPIAKSSPPVSEEHFADIVRAHQAAVFRTLHRLTGPGPHVEDLAQEVFLRLYRALPEFRGDAQLSTFLYRITVNVAQDEWKRRRRERTVFATPPALPDPDDNAAHWLENQPAASSPAAHHQTPEDHLQAVQAAAAVERALLQLPDVERNVLTLFHGEELPYDGIAAALGLPLNTVRTHLHRGRKRLAELVQQQLATATSPSPAQYAVRSNAE